MADTDIYKNREAMPMGKGPDKKKRRRRSESRRAFDDHSRKKRSKNSGFRRFLHLSRKSENDKMIWGAMGIVIVVVLVVIAVWQFVIAEHLIRKQEAANEYIEFQRDIPSMPDENAPSGGTEPIEQ